VARRKQEAVVEHEDISVPINKLHFDPFNPRGEPEDNEETIRHLYGSQSTTLKLAEHMAEHGINPLDRLGIIEHPKLPGHYIVREGNRRLCAMQLLRDPDRAEKPAERKAYRKLADGGRSIPDNIPAVIFREKVRARVWMSVKHEGHQGGIGTVTWGSGEKARFNREGETGSTRPKNPNRQAEALLSYAVSKGLITQEQRNQIAITTITRYLPNVRAALALLNNEDCTTNARPNEFNTALKRFLTDAIPPAPDELPAVNSRSDSSDRNDYAENLRKEGVSPANRDQVQYDPSLGLPALGNGEKKPKPRSANHPGKRKQLVPSSFVVTNRDRVLLRLVSEGKGTDPDDAAFSSNYLVRVILERIVHLYAKKHGVGAHGEFSAVVERVIEHALSSAQPPSKGTAIVMKKSADKKSAYSYEILSNPVHGGSIPTGADNRANWDSLEPALEYLLLALK
jgi:hypothetical protein